MLSCTARILQHTANTPHCNTRNTHLNPEVVLHRTRFEGVRSHYGCIHPHTYSMRHPCCKHANMHTYIYMHTYRYSYVCMHVCMHTNMYTCLYICMNSWKCLYTHETGMRVRTHKHIPVYVNVYVCLYVYDSHTLTSTR